MSNEILLTNKEVRDRFQISRGTLYNWVKAGKIKPVRITERSIRYAESEINKLIKKAS